MNRLEKAAKIAIPMALAMLPLLALAAVLPAPTVPITGNALTLDEIQSIIEKVAKFLIIVSVIIAVLFIVWGAILMMTAGGSGGMHDKGKGYIKFGLIGALVVFAVGVILQTMAGVVTRTFF